MTKHMLIAATSNWLTHNQKVKSSDLLHGGRKIAGGLAAAAAPVDGLVGIRIGIHIQIARLLGRIESPINLTSQVFAVRGAAVLLPLTSGRW